jgi:hypothetical protein
MITQQQAIEAMNNQVTSFFNEKLFQQQSSISMQLLANGELLQVNNILKMDIDPAADLELLEQHQQDCLLALLTDIVSYYDKRGDNNGLHRMQQKTRTNQKVFEAQT